MARFHVFFSHNSSDKPTVETLANRLRLAGIEPWLDKWNLIPGNPWQDEIEKALSDCTTCCVFIGPAGIGPWQNAEMRAAIDRRISEGEFRVIPVLLPGGTRQERSKLPTFLRQTTWVEFRDSIADEEAFHRLKCAILGIAPGPYSGTATPSGINPYRGLEVFDVQYAAFFFGREALTQWLLDELQSRAGVASNRFLAIVGASGSGKSSLARAGLLAAISKGALKDSNMWPVRIVKPGPTPIDSLALALASDSAEFKTLRRDLAEDTEQLHLVTRFMMRDKPESHRLVILVDQFEEVFTLCSSEPIRRMFIENLMTASLDPYGQTLVILTLRADFYGNCAEYDDLAAALADHQLLVGPMNEKELRDAIVKPAESVDCELESGLVEIFIRDIQGQAGRLPLLQYALTRLWEQRVNNKLTLAGYKQIGGLTGALDRQANNIYGALTHDEKIICRQIFLRLIEPGEGMEESRRRMPLAELGKENVTRQVLNKLVDARLVISESGGKNQESFVEISHEALIRNWSELRRWIETDKELLRVQHRLNETIREWEQNNRDEAYLYRGNRLLQAEEWAEERAKLSDSEKEFLNASLAFRDNERKLQRKSRRIINIALIAAVTLAGLAMWQWQVAKQQTKIAWQAEKNANEKRRIAEVGLANFLSSESSRLNPRERGELKLLLATEAMKITHTTRTDSALRQALNQHQVRALAGHNYAINAVAFSDDNRWVASASADRTVRIWDLRYLNRPAKILTGHEYGVTDVAFSDDSHWIATASVDKMVRIWDMTNLATPPKILKGHGQKVTSVAFSHDGRWLASGSYDRTVRIWDLENLDNDSRVLNGSDDDITALDFSRNNRWLASGCRDGTIRLWNVENFSAPAQVLNSHQREVYSVKFSFDSKQLASGGFEPFSFNVMSLWDLSDISRAPRPIRANVGFSDFMYSISSIAFSKSGKSLVTTNTHFAIQTWKLDQLDREPQSIPYGADVYSAALSRDGRWMATGGSDDVLRLWNLTGDFAQPKLLKDHMHWVFSLAISADGRWLAAGDQADQLHIWDLNNLDADHHFLKTLKSPAFSLAFSPDNRWLISRDGDGMLLMHDMNNPNSVPRRLSDSPEQGAFVTIAFSSDGQWLASSAGDAMHLINLKEAANHPKELMEHNSPVIAVAFLSGHRVASVTSNNTLRIWPIDNLNSKAIVFKLNGDKSSSAAFSPDGRWLALAESDKAIHVWDLDNLNTNPRFLTGNTQSRAFVAGGFPVAFSHDSRWLALGDGENSVYLWKLDDTHAPATLLQRHTNAVSEIVFDPQGHWLATGAYDMTVRLWDLPEELVKKACQSTGRNLTLAEWRYFLGDKPYERTCLQWTLPDDLIAEITESSRTNQASHSAIELLMSMLRHKGADERGIKQEAKRLWINFLIKKTVELPDDATETAVDYFNMASRFDPTLKIDDFPYNAGAWNRFCWNGSLKGYAQDVMPACNAAVGKASEKQSGYYLDSRALARALTGDFQGAADDLTAFLDWAPKYKKRISQEMIARRVQYLEELRAGRNPYNKTVINSLLRE